jgi:hypothetical protein
MYGLISDVSSLDSVCVCVCVCARAPIHTHIHTDTPQAKEETILEGKSDGLIEIRKCCGLEMNAEKTKVMRISRPPSPVQITVDQK